MRATPIKSIKNKRILLSPLNWGLGHVTRTIPIIQDLLYNKNEVIICCNAQQEDFYRHYFPTLWYIPFEGYSFQFDGKGNFELDFIKHYSQLHKTLFYEQKRVDELINKFNPDLLISDQRFGFRSSKVKSIIISHQLNLPASWWNFIGKWWNKRYLNAFDEIWIPDTAKHTLSGVLSEGNFKSKHFIGIQSRFRNDILGRLLSKRILYDYLCIISGPPPYNHQLFEIIYNKFIQTDKKCVIIAPFQMERQVENNIVIIPPPKHEDFITLLLSSKTIVSRNGYSTLMDMAALELQAILIPTPGQAEQEYLAQLHHKNVLWSFLTEKEFTSWIP